MTSCLFRNTLVWSSCVVSCMAASAMGQTNPPRVGYLTAVLQSQDVEVPEDFLVRVDSGKLEVALATFGMIDSRAPKSNLLVHLVNAMGQERTARTNSEGIASFDNVAADEHYAMVVAEQTAHVAVPVLTVSRNLAEEKGITNNQLQLAATTPNKEEILNAINRDIPPSNQPPGELFEVRSFKPEKLSSYRVKLQEDGSLLGRVVVVDRELEEALRYAKMNFVDGDRVVARVDSDPVDGSFKLSGIAPGVYGVIAAGPAGYASFAFDVLPADAALPRPATERPVSFVQNNSGDRLSVCLIPPRMTNKTTEIIRDAYGKPQVDAGQVAGQAPFGSPMGGGGFGGGGYGGGGGGGLLGGGGFGELIGLGALAALAAVIADSDEDNNNTNNVVSPISSQ